MVTIKDVARLAGTSPATISRFLNKSGYVKKATVEKIEKAIKELNYELNKKPESLSSNKTGTIALIIPDIRNPYFSELMHSIESTSKMNNYSVICCNSNNDIMKVSRYFDNLKFIVDGIIMAGEISINHIKELSDNDIPLIVVDAAIEDPSVHSINTNNKLGGKLATIHLIDQGYRRVGHIRGPLGTSTADERLKGYIEATTERDFEYDPVLVQIGDYDVEGGYEAMIRFLAQSNPPDAVFVANDLMALGAIKAINQVGLKVPHDIGIIGYDNIPLTNVIVPRLSTIQQPVNKLGLIATESILNIINRPNELVFKVNLEPSIIIRDTSLKNKGDADEK